MKKIKTWNFHFFKLSIIHQNEQSDPDPDQCTGNGSTTLLTLYVASAAPQILVYRAALTKT